MSAVSPTWLSESSFRACACGLVKIPWDPAFSPNPESSSWTSGPAKSHPSLPCHQLTSQVPFQRGQKQVGKEAQVRFPNSKGPGSLTSRCMSGDT